MSDQIFQEALEEIKKYEGRVCEEFELCTHASCQSSYNSWSIADEALNGRRLPNQGSHRESVAGHSDPRAEDNDGDRRVEGWHE